MQFTETKLKGAFILDLEPRSDQRGFFARTFCAKEFEAHNLKPTVAQCNLSFNYKKGTLRGMHYQIAPACETKLVRCTQGAIYDVIIDMRPDSPTYLEHIGVELTALNRRALYVPEMFAHGYRALTDEAEVVYRYWIYVDDVVDGLLAAATVSNVEGCTVELGSGILTPIHTVVEQLMNLVGSQVKPLFGALPDRPLEQVRVANTAYSYANLGWQPVNSLEKGLELTVEWYKTQLQFLLENR